VDSKAAHRIFPALQEMSINEEEGGLALRKFIFIVLSVLLVLSFTALALAEEPQIKLGGRILVRGWLTNNIEGFGGLEGAPVDASSTAFYTTNAYLTVDAKITDNLQAYMELETSGGHNPQSGLYIWGNHDSKPVADLYFRQLWIQYTGSGLLGCSSGIKVGHQLLTLGEKQFYNMERFGTDAIVVFTEPTKELFLGALTAKQVEGSINRSGDDIDAYAILGTYKMDKDNTLGLFVADVHTSDYILAPSVVDGVDLWNVGLHANGKIMNMLTYAAELDVQFGQLELRGPGAEDQDFGGWAIMAKLGYEVPAAPLTIRGSFVYGSGDNDDNDSNIDEFQFVGPFDTESAIARFPHYTQIYERSVNTAAAEQVFSGPDRNTGTANTTYYNLGLDYMPMKELAFSLDGFYLRATETALWGDDVSKNLGWEVDFKGSYKITKNLTYFVEAGWFNPGNFYDDVLGDCSKNVTQVIHGLNLTF
jgi:Alginate export